MVAAAAVAAVVAAAAVAAVASIAAVAAIAAIAAAAAVADVAASNFLGNSEFQNEALNATDGVHRKKIVWPVFSPFSPLHYMAGCLAL